MGLQLSHYATAFSAEEMQTAQGDPEPCWEIPPNSGRLQKAPQNAKLHKGMNAFKCAAGRDLCKGRQRYCLLWSHHHP